jgi:hypothetical protein
MEIDGGLSVIDGNHRIAAFCALQRLPDVKFQELGLRKAPTQQPLWIGTHTAGEYPLD